MAVTRKVVVLLAVGLVVGIVAGLVIRTGQLTGATKVTLPPEYQQLTPVIPGMGSHWANLADMPLGPILLLTEDSKILGVEYMYSEDMLEDVTIQTPEGPEYFKALSGLKISLPELGIEKTVVYADVGFMGHGHEGFDVPHWDLHFYFVSQDELAELTAPPT